MTWVTTAPHSEQREQRHDQRRARRLSAPSRYGSTGMQRADGERQERRHRPRPAARPGRRGRRRAPRGRAPRPRCRRRRGSAGPPRAASSGSMPLRDVHLRPARRSRPRGLRDDLAPLLVDLALRRPRTGWRPRCTPPPPSRTRRPPGRPARRARPRRVGVVAGAAGDAGDQREVGDQAVHRAEHRRPQPAAGDVGVVVVDLRDVGGQRRPCVMRRQASRVRAAHFIEGQAHLTSAGGRSGPGLRPASASVGGSPCPSRQTDSSRPGWRRPTTTKYAAASEEHDDRGPDVEPQAEDVVGLDGVDAQVLDPAAAGGVAPSRRARTPGRGRA